MTTPLIHTDVLDYEIDLLKEDRRLTWARAEHLASSQAYFEARRLLLRGREMLAVTRELPEARERGLAMIEVACTRLNAIEPHLEAMEVEVAAAAKGALARSRPAAPASSAEPEGDL